VPGEDPERPVLAYARPGVGPLRTRRLKHVLALGFAALALPLGALFVLNAVGYLGRSLAEPTTRERRLFREDALRCLACGVVLIAPGTRYALVGFRGESSDGDERTG
jgi:hypothetical protein